MELSTLGRYRNLLSEEARGTICKEQKCPNWNAGRTQGICIERQQNKFVCVNPTTPSVLILFRDPNTENIRTVNFILNIRYNVGEKVTSRLFEPYNKYLLSHIPDGEIIYLDNFIRCQVPNKTAQELTNNFMKESHPFAENCYQISKVLFDIFKLKCLIISNALLVIWLVQKGLMRCERKDIKQYIKDYKWDQSNKGNFKILLNECFTLDGYDFPVFYFPYPKNLNAHYKLSYANDINFKNHCDKITKIFLY